MLVHVRATDIKRGIRHHPASCPIARAIRRRQHFASISVGHYTVQIDRIDYILSRPAQAFVRAFDGHDPVRPATFRITKA